MSVEGYCRKQAERERRRASDVEARIEQIEARSAELLTRQRAADSEGSYAEVARLQDELEATELELEQAFEELHEVEIAVEQWEQLIDLAVHRA